MKSLIRLKDFSIEEICYIFELAEQLEEKQLEDVLKGQTIVLFFPTNSIRTRATFERGIYLLGGQSILFPSETLDKKEAIQDIVGYLENWASAIVIRYKDVELMERYAKVGNMPIINAMSKENHPCEILSDLYAISRLRNDYLKLHYTFVGERANIGKAWVEAAELLGLHLEQVCPKGQELVCNNPSFKVHYTLEEGIVGSDVVITDNMVSAKDEALNYQITSSIMAKANANALLNPCPPFSRGEEVSDEVIDSKYFVGYNFKKSLLYVQQAILLYCLYGQRSFEFLF